MKELIEAMSDVNDLNRTHGVTQRGGKKYTEVFIRVEALRKAFGTSLGIETEIRVDDGHRVVIQAYIKNDQGMTIGSGIAEEIRGSSNVNKTSAIENAETSAVGRALASLGLHGGQYASAFELEVAANNKEAIAQQQVPVSPQPQPNLTPPNPVDELRAADEEFTRQRIAEIQGINTLDELKQWDDYFSDQLDRLNLSCPDLYKQIELEANKRKAFL